ncbi:MAG TPA: hypothetical protein VFQ61_01555 [Polyangiaceae bacterium]|nr:hypothetical protein [Polyangiaceae bacterium]
MAAEWVTRRKLGLLGLAAITVGAGYALWGKSDERRVLEMLRDLARDLATTAEADEQERRRIAMAALSPRVAPRVELSVPEFGESEGIESLADLLAQSVGTALRFSIEQANIHVTHDQAMATLLGTVTAERPGQEIRDSRTVRVSLTRHGPRFRIVRIRVEERSRAQPEARP